GRQPDAAGRGDAGAGADAQGGVLAVASPRPFALIRTSDQWLRVAHEGHATALDEAQGVVSLAWTVPDPVSAPGMTLTLPTAAGLAFDNECRLYHSVPSEGRIERFLWAGDPQAPESLEPLIEAPAST